MIVEVGPHSRIQGHTIVLGGEKNTLHTMSIYGMFQDNPEDTLDELEYEGLSLKEYYLKYLVSPYEDISEVDWAVVEEIMRDPKLELVYDKKFNPQWYR